MGSLGLLQKANAAQAESVKKKRLFHQLKLERMHLTFHSATLNFTSEDAREFLKEYNNTDTEVGLMERIIYSRNTLVEFIKALESAENEYEAKLQEKNEVDRNFEHCQHAFE